ADVKTTLFWGGRSSPPGPNGDAAGLPNGLVVRRYKRLVAYRVTSFDGVVRIVAGLLHRIAVSSRGSVVYVNAGKLARYLGLGGPIHPIDLSVVYATMEKLGFEVVEAGRGKAIVIDMGKPIMREIKSAKSIDEVIKIVEKHLR
nr:hypothetical protein [Vulcanisaeta sp.]MCG2892829.1 hypothetical protein [Vulcanisaeta sp.]